MTALWKQARAEADLEPLLRRVRGLDPTVLDRFPRNMEHILALGLPSLMLREIPGLRGADVKRVLREELGIHCDVVGDAQELSGLTYATDKLVVIFVDTQFGDEAARFTLAHEAGHLATEYVRRLERGELADARILLADPAENLGRTRASPRREVIANSCAAALLAPMAEVRRVVAEAGASEAVDAVRYTFGMSRQAAGIRLEELGLDGGRGLGVGGAAR